MKKLVISTGAGVSAESGISTFRDAGGLWENYPVMDVCSADGFARNLPSCTNFTTSDVKACSTVCPTRHI